MSENINHPRLKGYFTKLVLLLIVAIILAVRACWFFLSDATQFPINTVHIEASYQHLSHKQLQTILQPYVKKSFFSINISQLVRDLQALDRIKTVRAEREWPDKINLYLKEKKPFARWNQALITQNGEIFSADERDDATTLPSLYGPSHRLGEVLEQYKILSKILSEYHLSASIVKLRNNQAWEITLSNGILLRLGKKNINEKLLRFSKSFSTLTNAGNTLPKMVDLRYPRGMSVNWKS